MPILSARMRIIALTMLVLTSACSSARLKSNEPVDNGRQGALDGLGEGSLARDAEPGSILTSHNLRWPLRRVQVTSYFGPRGRGAHEGIDLRAHDGTPVLAAQAGQVIYAGSKIRGYGRLVVIRHGDDVNTIYAHNSKILVRKGQRVKAGQRIALSGHSGHASGPHLHFEIRKGIRPVNPIAALPPAHLAGRVVVVSEEVGPSTDTVASSAAAPEAPKKASKTKRRRHRVVKREQVNRKVAQAEGPQS